MSEGPRFQRSTVATARNKAPFSPAFNAATGVPSPKLPAEWQVFVLVKQLKQQKHVIRYSEERLYQFNTAGTYHGEEQISKNTRAHTGAHARAH